MERSSTYGTSKVYQRYYQSFSDDTVITSSSDKREWCALKGKLLNKESVSGESRLRGKICKVIVIKNLHWVCTVYTIILIYALNEFKIT